MTLDRGGHYAAEAEVADWVDVGPATTRKRRGKY